MLPYPFAARLTDDKDSPQCDHDHERFGAIGRYLGSAAMARPSGGTKKKGRPEAALLDFARLSKCPAH